MRRHSLKQFLSLFSSLFLTCALTAQPLDAKKWPPELVKFVRPYKTNPVFTAANGQSDGKIRERGWIMREDGVYTLWYTGYDGSKDGGTDFC